MPAGKSAAVRGNESDQNRRRRRSGKVWLEPLDARRSSILALFVLPIMVGNYLAKIWRMPDHAWKMSLVIGAARRIDPHLLASAKSRRAPTWPAASR